MGKMIRAIAMSTAILSSVAFAKVNYQFVEQPSEDSKQLVLFAANADSLTGPAAALEQESAGHLSRALKAQSFGADGVNQAVVYGVAKYDKVIVLHLSEEVMNERELHDLGGKVAKAAGANLKGESLVVYAENLPTSVDAPQAHLAFGYELQNYRFDKYKSNREVREGTVAFVTSSPNNAQNKYENDLAYLADGVYLTRDLASEPGKTIYPQSFVDRIKAQFKGIKNVDIDVLTLRDMKKLNMGALMGVGQGSIHEPKLLVIEYQGDKGGQAPIALAGKGITFDTGGISIKPSSGMWAMKSDMSGAAAVAGTLYAAAKRGEKVNLVGIMPLAENMPAEDAIRPGDVLETMKGTTIEVMSTDAEGRLILADAVFYAQKTFKPRLLVNIATLTGSAARALSDEYAAVITRDWALSEQMMEIGKVSGEDVWPLPLHPNHFEQIKSDIADIKNSDAGNPGASIGAAVIGTFVAQDQPWVHLDIAGVDWLTSATDTVPAGSWGWGVRFMDQLVREMK